MPRQPEPRRVHGRRSFRRLLTSTDEATAEQIIDELDPEDLRRVIAETRRKCAQLIATVAVLGVALEREIDRENKGESKVLHQRRLDRYA